MSTHNVVSVESPTNAAADMDDAGAGAQSARPDSSQRMVRVSLYGCILEMAEDWRVATTAILGC